MGARHPNPRRVKIHRPYTVEQLAAVLKVHKNTIRRWAKDGLRPIDDRRPSMFRGADVIGFLSARRQAAKRRCAAGEIYCLPCRMPKSPAGLVADLYVKCSTVGWLVAICPTCSRMLYRRVNPSRIDLVRGNLDIAVRQGQARIADRAQPISNGDSEGAAKT
jgi:Helix-turn-helix domain